MDKYIKLILTVIAVGIIGINVQLFKDDLISSANAEVGGMTAYDLKTDLEKPGKGLPPKSGGGSRRKQTKKKKRR